MSKKLNIKYFLFFILWLIVLLLITETGSRIYLKSHPHLLSPFSKEYNRVILENVSILKEDPQTRGFTIFFFGGSTMEGFPFKPIVSPVKWIQTFFKHNYSDTKVNLINFGEGGKNSIYIEQALKQSLIYKPDIVVLLFGHNEFLRNVSERDQSFRDFFINKSAFLTLINIGLKTLKEKIQLHKFKKEMLHTVNTSITSQEESPDNKTIKNEKVEKKPANSQQSQLLTEKKTNFFHPVDFKWVISGSPEMQERLTMFEKRFTRIISLCRDKNIPVIVAAPPFNMKFRPYGHPLFVQGQERKKWNDHAHKGMALFSKKQFKEALIEFLKADTIDGTNALLSSYIARSYENLGDFLMAEQYYYKTSRHDIRRSSIFSDLESVIQKTCEKQNVPYHNIHKDFVTISKNRIVGYEYIIDNVHPNLKGQYLLSQFLFEHIINHSSFFTTQRLTFPDYESLIEQFSHQKEFNYVTNKHLGDYYVNHFDKAFVYYQKAFEAMPTQEMCMRIIQLCMKHGRYEEVRPYIEKLTTLEEKGVKFRIPYM